MWGAEFIKRVGAGNQVRTGDLNLGKVALYQLSYSRGRTEVNVLRFLDKFSAKNWSGKPGSNWRPQPWQGCALPTELFPHRSVYCGFTRCNCQGLCPTVYVIVLRHERCSHVSNHRPDSQRGRNIQCDQANLINRHARTGRVNTVSTPRPRSETWSLLCQASLQRPCPAAPFQPSIHVKH